MIKIQFLGAAGFVTGSSYLVTHDKGRFLVDCGFFQGDKKTEAHNYEEFKYDPSAIDFLLLTHAHLDHSGLIPKLYKAGFRSPIYTTQATTELTAIVLTDAAGIQENGAREDQMEELFGTEDAESALKLFKQIDFDTETILPGDIRVRFVEAGHILGAASIEVWVDDKKIVFSGDLGNSPVPLMKAPTLIAEADYVVCESTYGGKIHEDSSHRAAQLTEILMDAKATDGKVLIPVFALERTQDVLYELDQLFEAHPELAIPVYLDSPMAIRATGVFKKHYDLLDSDFQRHRNIDIDPLAFENLTYTNTADQSKGLNNMSGPMIILAGSGMADAGRILHHLKNHLGQSNTHVVFVGFQVEGTLGSQLVSRSKSVKIFGEHIDVKAKIYDIESFSAHADQNGLMAWLEGFTTSPQIFLTHGEEESRQALLALITKKLNPKVQLPELFSEIEL
jgi:metallo-beta-lactamase family protein